MSPNFIYLIIVPTFTKEGACALVGTSAESVFVEVEPILRSAMDGRNVCVFAYGQTGTCKTFTMVSQFNIVLLFVHVLNTLITY